MPVSRTRRVIGDVSRFTRGNRITLSPLSHSKTLKLSPLSPNKYRLEQKEPLPDIDKKKYSKLSKEYAKLTKQNKDLSELYNQTNDEAYGWHMESIRTEKDRLKKELNSDRLKKELNSRKGGKRKSVRRKNRSTRRR